MTERLISACGLVCSECDAYAATQAGDAAAIERVADEWSKQYGRVISPETVWCDGCMTAGERKVGHAAECEIRSCVVGQGLANCAACDAYVCDKLESFLTMAADSGARERLESLRA